MTKQLFEQTLLTVNREGINKVIEWLQTKDFYTAPASAKHHGNYPGGLVEHSMNVYRVLA